MDTRLQLFIIACIVLYLIIILYLLKKKRLNLKYTLLWFLTALVMLVVTIFPGIVNWATGLVGIVAPTNFVFFLEGAFVSRYFIVVNLHCFQFKQQNLPPDPIAGPA